MVIQFGRAIATAICAVEIAVRPLPPLFHLRIADYESSPGVKRSFCDQCGTPMAFHGQKFPEEVHLSPRTLGNPGDYPAQFQVFCATKLPWLSIDDHTQKFETLPTE